MLAEAANELYGLIAGVPALNQTVGLAVGGQLPDPGNALIKLPAAWVLFAQEDTLEDQNLGQVPVLGNGVLTFWVMLYIPYKGQQDLILNQLPLLETVKRSVHGYTSVATGRRWQFKTMHMVLINTDRMGYRFVFSLDSI